MYKGYLQRMRLVRGRKDLNKLFSLENKVYAHMALHVKYDLTKKRKKVYISKETDNINSLQSSLKSH